MKKAESPARWYQVWRPRRAAADDDAADMGTAFGLDMSILDDAAEPASGNAAKRREPGREPGRDPGFMARWKNRRKTAS